MHLTKHFENDVTTENKDDLGYLIYFNVASYSEKQCTSSSGFDSFCMEPMKGAVIKEF
jgi:hypothetical protein